MRKNEDLLMIGFIGTKSVLATPMSRAEYYEYRGWKIPDDEDPNEPVYLVEYTDGGKPNDDRHSGYITMSPKEVFDNAYRQNGSLNFGDALMALKQGKKASRSGWNGKKMHIEFRENTDGINPHFVVKNAQGSFDFWVASVSDSLAEDWFIWSNK